MVEINDAVGVPRYAGVVGETDNGYSENQKSWL